MVFQSADAQLFNPTVRDEVAFGPLHLDLPHDEIVARVDDTLAMLGLGALADRAPYNLSGGEKKKVALASVLSINPEVLMLDEPTNGLDPRTQEWLIELLATLNRAGKTIVVATHELSVLERLVDRAVVLGEDHRPAADGRLADVLGDRDLLLAVNLIHEHTHRHGALLHSHPHAHPPGRERHGEDEPEHHHEHGGRDVTTNERDGNVDALAAASAGREVAVRTARAGDAPALAALATELGYHADTAQIERRLHGVLADVDDVVFVAVAPEGDVVGFVHAFEKRLLVSDPYVELGGLIVVATARRRGAARLLIAAVERWTLARGVDLLRVRTRVEREEANVAYRRCGFELEKEQRVFVKQLA